MTGDDRGPTSTFVLTDDEGIRAYVHPTRMSILSMLGRRSMTATGVARELGVHPANLTRHFRLLERTGLIRLVEKRDTGRNLEKYYRAVALAFEVRMRSERSEDRRATALAILRDNLSSAVATARGDSSGDVLGLLEQARLDRRRLPKLTQRLQALVEEFAALDSTEGVSYSLSVALYPNEAAEAAPSGDEVVIGPRSERRDRR